MGERRSRLDRQRGRAPQPDPPVRQGAGPDSDAGRRLRDGLFSGPPAVPPMPPGQPRAAGDPTVRRVRAASVSAHVTAHGRTVTVTVPLQISISLGRRRGPRRRRRSRTGSTPDEPRGTTACSSSKRPSASTRTTATARVRPRVPRRRRRSGWTCPGSPRPRSGTPPGSRRRGAAGRPVRAEVPPLQRRPEPPAGGWRSSRRSTSTARPRTGRSSASGTSGSSTPGSTATEQVGNEFYKGTPFDRGHLVRRLDPAWGRTGRSPRSPTTTRSTSPTAAPSTSGSTRARTSGPGWRTSCSSRAVERPQAADRLHRPGLRDDDPKFRGVPIPRDFWKVAVMIRPERPARGPRRSWSARSRCSARPSRRRPSTWRGRTRCRSPGSRS